MRKKKEEGKRKAVWPVFSFRDAEQVNILCFSSEPFKKIIFFLKGEDLHFCLGYRVESLWHWHLFFIFDSFPCGVALVIPGRCKPLLPSDFSLSLSLSRCYYSGHQMIDGRRLPEYIVCHSHTERDK